MPKTITSTRMTDMSREQTQAIARLVGQPVSPLTEELTPWQKIALLQKRLSDLENPEKNPVQSNYYAFLKHCVWTKDEARAGKVARAPDWEYLEELCDYLVTEPKIFIEKSRRVFASWTVCGFDVWLAAGGQDPRWPELMNNTAHRQIYVVGRKFENSDWFLRERVWFIIQQFEEKGERAKWPEFPRFSYKEGNITGSNGSNITAVAQGADQLRGPGATWVHLEELAFWESAHQTVEGLLPIIQGGGRVCGITTPQVGSYAQAIRDGTLKSRGVLRQ